MAAGDTDAVQLVFGDDAPAEVHAAWAVADPRAASGASAAAAGATGGTALASAPGTDVAADASGGPGAAAALGEAWGKPVTGAQAALVARLVAALSGGVFDSGDVRGVALSGGLVRRHTHQVNGIVVVPVVQNMILARSSGL
jgi:hypothetical protein